MAKKMNDEPKVRTRTRVRAGGDYVKTKTVTKGDGMKRVEKTKTNKGLLGTSTSRSVYEGGPKGKSKSSSYMYKSKDGGSYGFNLEKTKKGGVKNVRSSDVDSYNMPATTYYTSRSGKVNVPAYSSTDKTFMSKTKGKGYKSKVKKTTYGEGYDIYGKYVPEKTMVKSKKSK
jgi:hypothetical protein